MQTKWITGALCGALALGGTAFAADTAKQKTGAAQPGAAQPGATQADAMDAQGEEVQLSGVVSKHKGGKLTVVAPLGEETTFADVGDAIVIERELNLVSVQGKVDNNTTIMRDGKKANLTQLKEGDFVRAAWDAEQKAYTSVEATSPDQLEKQRGPASGGPEGTSPSRPDGSPQQPGTLPEE